MYVDLFPRVHHFYCLPLGPFFGTKDPVPYPTLLQERRALWAWWWPGCIRYCWWFRNPKANHRLEVSQNPVNDDDIYHINCLAGFLPWAVVEPEIPWISFILGCHDSLVQCLGLPANDLTPLGIHFSAPGEACVPCWARALPKMRLTKKVRMQNDFFFRFYCRYQIPCL